MTFRPRLLALMVIPLAIPLEPASAEPIVPVVEVGGVVQRNAGALGAELEGGRAVRVALGAGLGRFGLLVPFEIGSMTSLHPERDNDSLSVVGLEVAADVRIVQGESFGLHLRPGYGWRWLSGRYPVQRTCGEVGGCDAGFWTETPSYRMDGPSIALVATGSRRLSGTLRLGFAVEAQVARPSIDLPGTGKVDGTLLSLAASLWFGG